MFKSERLARGSGLKDEARSVMEVYVDLRRSGVQPRSVEDDVFLTNPMLVGVADAMAHKFGPDLAAHVRRGIVAQVRGGKPWGAPKWPFTKGADGHWTPIPEAVPIYRLIYTERVEHGRSKAGIAKQLTRDRVPTATGSRAWSPTVVSRILRGREGLGEFKHGGEWHRGRHDPLVAEDVWQAAQRMDEQGRKFAPGGRSGALPKRHVFVRGFLRCACGEAMLPRSAGDQADHYVCRARKLDSRACDMPILRRDAMDEWALSMFEMWAQDIEPTRRHLAEQVDHRAEETAAQLHRTERELADLAAQLDRVEGTTDAGRSRQRTTPGCAPRSATSEQPRPPSATAGRPHRTGRERPNQPRLGDGDAAQAGGPARPDRETRSPGPTTPTWKRSAPRSAQCSRRSASPKYATGTSGSASLSARRCSTGPTCPTSGASGSRSTTRPTS